MFAASALFASMGPFSYSKCAIDQKDHSQVPVDVLPGTLKSQSETTSTSQSSQGWSNDLRPFWLLHACTCYTSSISSNFCARLSRRFARHVGDACKGATQGGGLGLPMSVYSDQRESFRFYSDQSDQRESLFFWLQLCTVHAYAGLLGRLGAPTRWRSKHKATVVHPKTPFASSPPRSPCGASARDRSRALHHVTPWIFQLHWITRPCFFFPVSLHEWRWGRGVTWRGLHAAPRGSRSAFTTIWMTWRTPDWWSNEALISRGGLSWSHYHDEVFCQS